MKSLNIQHACIRIYTMVCERARSRSYLHVTEEFIFANYDIVRRVVLLILILISTRILITRAREILRSYTGLFHMKKVYVDSSSQFVDPMGI